MRRLHLKLYLAVVGTLVAFTLAAALVWHFFGLPRAALWGVESATGVTALSFDRRPLAPEEEDALLAALAQQLRADVALFAPGSSVPQKSHGHAFIGTPEQLRRRGWQVTRAGPLFNRELADGRRLIVHPRHRVVAHGLHLGGVLVIVAVVLALLTYPVTRGITARLERLRTGVRELGAGNLAARVAVEGRDEVAALARSFNESAERVEQLVRAHKLLLANCSHELRTPLARIRLAIEKLATGTPAHAEMIRSIAELDALIGEMLLASRLDAMRRPERLERVDLLALAAEEAAHFARDATGRAAQVNGDPNLLRRMVRNLLDNAQRHAGGATRIEVLAEADGSVRLVVEDAGPGVEPSERDRIFEPFHRLANPPGETRGAGLGLSIVRQIARAHGGEVICEAAGTDAGARGARFTITLPGGGAPG